MGLPGHRRTSSHKRRRAAHFALKKQAVAGCPQCHAPIQPHRACADCGTYAGRKVKEMPMPHAGHDHAGHDHTGHDHAA
jgi:large subunit ribosomal protein L32